MVENPISNRHNLDIIIPVLNEEAILREESDYYLFLKNKANVIFVDGGSIDKTISIAKKFGTVITSSEGRAIQKNTGSRYALSEHLLFLHVDSFINPDSVEDIIKCMDKDISCGCLTMKIKDPRFIFRIFEKIVNFRAKNFGILDGDLGLFIKKSAFNRLGQFDILPIMEDIVFGKKAKKALKPEVLPIPIIVSSRKWHEKGFVRTLFLYFLAYIQLWIKKG